MASGIDAMRQDHPGEGTGAAEHQAQPDARSSRREEAELDRSRPRRSQSLLTSAATVKQIHLLRGDLDWIVMKCLEKDRTRRYETANGLASDIQRHLNNEAVLARPPSAAYRFQKLVRRNKAMAAPAAAIATVLVLGK